MAHNIRYVAIRIFLISCFLVFSGCESVPMEVPSLLEPSNGYGQEPEEQKLISQAKEFEEQMRNDGLLIQDPILDEYLNTVGQKLVPEAVKEQVNFHFGVVKDPTINAFSLPNGGIYFHTGLLARLKNESQLAFVTSHEIGHVTERHMLEVFRNFQKSILLFSMSVLCRELLFWIFPAHIFPLMLKLLKLSCRACLLIRCCAWLLKLFHQNLRLRQLQMENV